MANQFLSLSLFIMMLSFFIILNTVSDFEQVKSKPVLNSISQAFAGKQLEEKLLPNTTEAPEQASNEGDTLDKLDKLFNAQISGAEISRNRLGTMMHIRVPVSEFEKSINVPDLEMESAANGSEGFLPTLISLVQTKDAEITYRMNMVLNTQNSAAVEAKKNPQKLKKDIETVAGFSQTLQTLGIPTKLMSAGLVQGDPQMIDIYFRPYRPFNPVGLSGEETAEEAQ